MQKKGLFGLIAHLREVLASLVRLAAFPGSASKSRGSSHRSCHLGERTCAVHNVYGGKGGDWNEALKEPKRKEVGDLELKASLSYF